MRIPTIPLGSGYQLQGVCGGGGGVQNRRGGTLSFTPTKRGAGKVLAILKEGTTNVGIILTRVLEVLTILEEGTKGFHSFITGGGEA